MHMRTQSSQMKPVWPDTIRDTSAADLPQKEQRINFLSSFVAIIHLIRGEGRVITAIQ